MDTVNLPLCAEALTDAPRSAPVARVGVVILNWNGKEVLRECLQSLIRSRYPNLDIIVVDNGSSDRSCEIAASEFPAVALVRNPQNLGFCAGNNQGMRMALERNNDYVLILNNDTVLHPDCINRLVEGAQGDSSVAAVSPKIYFSHQADRIWFAGGTFNFWTGCNGHVGYRRRERFAWNTRRSMDFICACAMLVSRRAWQEVGGFDELLFRSAEDLDWSLRARRAGYRLLYEPEAVIWHRESFDILRNEGSARQMYFYTRNQLAVMWKHAQARYWLTFLPYFAFRCARRMLVAAAKRDWETVVQITRGVAGFTAFRHRLQRWPRQAHAVSNVRNAKQQWQRAWTERNLQREVELCRHRELRRHLAEALSQFKDSVIVEAGCGNGAWVGHLREKSCDRVIAVDNYFPALQELKACFPNSLAISADVRHMPLPDNFADICISLGVVEHFPSGPQQVLSEMYRILRPDGLLFLTVPYYNWLRRLFIHPLRAAYMAVQARVCRRPLHFVEYRFTKQGIAHASAAAGLEVMKVVTDEFDRANPNLGLGLYVDLPAFRGSYPGELNWLGTLVRSIGNAINPWSISGGVLVVARKNPANASGEPAARENLCESLA